MLDQGGAREVYRPGDAGPAIEPVGVCLSADAKNSADVFCAATATATSQTAVGMLNAVFPVALSAISHSGMDDHDRSTMILSLVAIQAAANAILAQYAVPTGTEAVGGAVSQ